MESFASLESALRPLRQPVVVTDGAKVLFANPAAVLAFGPDIAGKKPGEIFPAEMLDNQPQSFASSAKILNKHTTVFATKLDGFFLYYLDADSGDRTDNSLAITRYMISYLRNCMSGLKIAADRCFSQIEGNISPDDKLISILYHYYYRLTRAILQLDSADKLERDEMVFSPIPVDIISLCSALTGTLVHLCREKNVNIILSAEDESLVTMADPSLIEFMLLNLFSNSLKNTDSGDTIEFGVKQANGKIIISLDDNGCGIAQDKLHNIFALPRNSKDITKANEGIGLGLYISHELVQLHDGVMLIESREGEGVHIRILLPIKMSDDTSLSSGEAPYRTGGMSPALTGLADVLSSDCYGPKYED